MSPAQKITVALMIWLAVSFALGFLCSLAITKIKRRKKFLAERGAEYEVIGDFTLLRDEKKP